jgi:hypothetical protein
VKASARVAVIVGTFGAAGLVVAESGDEGVVFVSPFWGRFFCCRVVESTSLAEPNARNSPDHPDAPVSKKAIKAMRQNTNKNREMVLTRETYAFIIFTPRRLINLKGNA